MDVRHLCEVEAHITLSRSNLLALLANVDNEEFVLNRFTKKGILSVTAESDEKHYEGRERGIMDPETEAKMSGSSG